MLNVNNGLTKKPAFRVNFANRKRYAAIFYWSLMSRGKEKVFKGFLLGLLMVTMVPVNAQVEDSKKQFNVYWDNGLSMETEDEEVKLGIGGRLQHDWAFITKDNELESTLGKGDRYNTGFRRVRLFQDGTIGQNFEYKLQLDFAGGSTNLKDVYLQIADVPVVGNIRVGHQKEFFSMEQMASSNDVVFMERSLGDLFIPTRNPGITAFDHYMNGRITWGAGIHRSANGFGQPGQTTQGNFNATGRVVGLPWKKDDTHLLALGSAISRRDPDDNEVDFRTEPESRLAGDYIQTGLINDVRTNVVSNHSVSFLYGSLNIQGEYMASRVNNDNSMLFSGYYGQISYFLTNDTRNYSPKAGSFDGTIPKNNFNLQQKNGTGALEVALRYSTLDLDDEFNQGGEITDITGGINWYLNPNSRIMFNYVLADVEGSGRSNIFQTRFQVTF